MDTHLLRMFCCVARLGSATEASRELHLTRSAISHGLRNLENQLGCRLFERAGNRILLNQAGEHLLAQVKKPLAALNAAEESVKGLGKWTQTRLRIGAAASACQHVIPPVVREMKKTYPDLSLLVQSGDMPQMIDLIESNRVDLAIGVAPKGGTNLETRPVFKDELLFAFSPSHPWSTSPSISREDLRTQPLILYQRSSLTAGMIDDYFHGLDITPSAIMEIGNIEAIKELVKLNLGVSILAPWTVHEELARGDLKMRPLGPKPLRRQWVAAFMPDRRLGLAEETFCRLCQQMASRMRLERRDLFRT
jgi:DNA-binding transcriptional LysR family regulator